LLPYRASCPDFIVPFKGIHECLEEFHELCGTSNTIPLTVLLLLLTSRTFVVQ
jgi:hypothetical protein